MTPSSPYDRRMETCTAENPEMLRRVPRSGPLKKEAYDLYLIAISMKPSEDPSRKRITTVHVWKGGKLLKPARIFVYLHGRKKEKFPKFLDYFAVEYWTQGRFELYKQMQHCSTMSKSSSRSTIRIAITITTQKPGNNLNSAMLLITHGL
jgi:hypothetical protein